MKINQITIKYKQPTETSMLLGVFRFNSIEKYHKAIIKELVSLFSIT